VIGSGISGLSSAYLLQVHNDMAVTLFESESTFGGHTLTGRRLATLSIASISNRCPSSRINRL
jgi:predicted NAD/FAD-binding protein